MHTHHSHQAPRQKHAPTAPPASMELTTTTRPAGASIEKDPKVQQVSAEDIRLCAYRKWERAGKPTGDGFQFWLEAEQELAQSK